MGIVANCYTSIEHRTMLVVWIWDFFTAEVMKVVANCCIGI